MMRRITHPFVLLAGCFFLLLGFLLPWYTVSPDAPFFGKPVSATISGWHLWLGGPTASLSYTPEIVPAFFALLWVWLLAILLLVALSVGELTVHRWRDRWAFLGASTTLLTVQGIFLWPALWHTNIQVGLWVCLMGWILLLLGVLTRFSSRASGSITNEATHLSPQSSQRRALLRGFVGSVGLVSLGGTGGFLLWRNGRTHTDLTTYRFRQGTTGQTGTGNAPDFNDILSVDWSPNGKRILVAQSGAPPQSWDAFTGEAS